MIYRIKDLETNSLSIERFNSSSEALEYLEDVIMDSTEYFGENIDSFEIVTCKK